MTDRQWITKTKRIKDPLEMLECIVKNENFLGYDPYYAEIRATMINTAEKIVKEAKMSGTPDREGKEL